MIIGIVCAHTHFVKYLPPEEIAGDMWINFPALGTASYICYWLICKMFTLTFFFISGYLFFREHQLDRQLYAGKLRRRVSSLLVPYIIWNAIALLVMYVQSRWTNGISSHIGDVADYGVKEVIYAFFDCSQNWSFVGDIGKPANTPLWFLRDLMILSILSPLFYYLAKWKKWLAPFVLLAIYMSPIHLPHLRNLSIFWFGLGVWAQLNDIDLVGVSRRLVKWCLPVFVVATTLQEYFWVNGIRWQEYIMVPVMRVAEFPLLIALTSWVLTKTTRRIPQSLSKGSFFVYLSHVMPTALLCMLTCRYLPHYDGLLTVAYLLIPWVVTACLLAIYLFLARFMPHTLAVLVGKRHAPPSATAT